MSNKSKIFLFLDAYRSLCALVVMVSHSYESFQDGSMLIDHFFRLFQFYPQTFGVGGFFLLSSFLLTYRLLNEFWDLNPDNKFKNTIILVSKYILRRFFRVYFPCLVYLAVDKVETTISNYIFTTNQTVDSWIEVITIQKAPYNHLWTIPVEIMFYAIIPFICLPSLFKFKKMCIVLTMITLIVVDLYWNFDTYQYKLVKHSPIYQFKQYCLPVFLEGSFIALVYFYLEKYHKKIVFNQFNYLNNICCFILVLIGIFLNQPLRGIPIISKSLYQGPSLVWSGVIILMLINENNLIKIYILEKNWLLIKLSTFSYGIYLWHGKSIAYMLSLNSKYPIKFISYLDKLFVIITICFTISYLFYYTIELKSIKLGQAICERLDFIKSNTNEFPNLKVSYQDDHKIEENNFSLNKIQVNK